MHQDSYILLFQLACCHWSLKALATDHIINYYYNTKVELNSIPDILGLFLLFLLWMKQRAAIIMTACVKRTVIIYDTSNTMTIAPQGKDYNYSLQNNKTKIGTWGQAFCLQTLIQQEDAWVTLQKRKGLAYHDMHDINRVEPSVTINSQPSDLPD